MNSGLNITDIAFQTGFGSHSSFAKAFKKEFGMTASEYVAAQKNK
ncbi:MAG: AraC family transcriptional regulator [Muribaculaceae bacterium]